MQVSKEDLNALRLQTDGPGTVCTFPEHRCAPIAMGSGTVYFADLEAHLITHILAAEVVVGCVAWLTNENILRALAAVPGGVNLVVQKEDFLRPDITARRSWTARLHTLYNALRPGTDRDNCGTSLEMMSMCVDPTIEAVRCVGNYNSAKVPAHPRMHHKFLVFCSRETEEQAEDTPAWEEPRDVIVPYAVWTGSFNFTVNATYSFENALYLTDPQVIQAYYEEWGWIEGLSEPLDWYSVWCEPQWRIGT